MKGRRHGHRTNRTTRWSGSSPRHHRGNQTRSASDNGDQGKMSHQTGEYRKQPEQDNTTTAHAFVRRVLKQRCDLNNMSKETGEGRSTDVPNQHKHRAMIQHELR